MIIEWNGACRFHLTGEIGSVWMECGLPDDVPDPASLLDVDADVVTLAHGPAGEALDPAVPAPHAPDHGPFVVHGPGEYEVHGVFVTAVAVYPPGSASPHLVVNVLVDGVAVCHLGPCAMPLDKDQIETLGDIDVLLAPLGGFDAPDPGRAAEAVAALDPRLVVPMGIDLASADGAALVERFVTELGLEPMDPQPRLQVVSSQTPEELQAVVLAAQN